MTDERSAPDDEMAFPVPEQPPMDDAAGGPQVDPDNDKMVLPPTPGPEADKIGDFA